ncbi:SPFH domain-containing protein [Trichormus azollae]|uniref:SPFH domain-containing protein n=1 Tax=Trichormus azollae TaxID=1164 RepID=UPI00325D01BB
MSKDLQSVSIDVALNWHIKPGAVKHIFRKIGEEKYIIKIIINPAIEEIIKAVIAQYTAAQYTAEKIITRRGDVKAKLDEFLTKRVDDIYLVHIRFSDSFREAAEAEMAEYVALKAAK